MKFGQSFLLHLLSNPSLSAHGSAQPHDCGKRNRQRCRCFFRQASEARSAINAGKAQVQCLSWIENGRAVCMDNISVSILFQGVCQRHIKTLLKRRNPDTIFMKTLEEILQAAPKPTIPATFSVPARSPNSCSAPPKMMGANTLLSLANSAPMPFGRGFYGKKGKESRTRFSPHQLDGSQRPEHNLCGTGYHASCKSCRFLQSD